MENASPDLLPEQQPAPASKTTRLKRWIAGHKWPVTGGAAIVVILVALGLWFGLRGSDNPKTTTVQKALPNSTSTASSTTNLPGLQLDSNKNYGNKYADGILPTGDGKYTTDGAKQGYIYACQGYSNNLKSQQGGAGQRGPWFVGTTQYDINKKLHVQGDVMWQASFSNTVSGDTRTIISNNLPNHPTGVFPISPTDPAYAYDRNPSSIEGQTMTYQLSADPTYSLTPTCEKGQVGVMLTGVALFNGFDAAGRDAGAWEIQDSCQGHPQKDGIYHYHTLSSCIKDVSVRTVIGFALDGFPITGPQVSKNNILTTQDLDECHGLTSQVVLDGKNVTTYHYVMTQDFPYSANCFRGAAIQPPGMDSQQGSPSGTQNPSGGTESHTGAGTGGGY
ncbi:MAG TPA: YHYH protein [Candidatus Saccharimonadales bacterium]|nr:YHYH protein [Candidatus Saccharimonadales bacterium]